MRSWFRDGCFSGKCNGISRPQAPMGGHSPTIIFFLRREYFFHQLVNPADGRAASVAHVSKEQNMAGKANDEIVHDHNHDGIDRRGFLKCMAWAGTGVTWALAGGVLTSQSFGQKMKAAKGELHFVQISDTHMGFNKPANPDVGATLQATIDKIK